MNSETDIAARCQEFTDALTEVLAENAIGLARGGRLARAHAAVKHHPEFGTCILCSGGDRFYAMGGFAERWSLKSGKTRPIIFSYGTWPLPLTTVPRLQIPAA